MEGFSSGGVGLQGTCVGVACRTDLSLVSECARVVQVTLVHLGHHASRSLELFEGQESILGNEGRVVPGHSKEREKLAFVRCDGNGFEQEMERAVGATVLEVATGPAKKTFGLKDSGDLVVSGSGCGVCQERG